MTTKPIKEPSPSTIGDLVLGFNSLLVDACRAGMTAQTAERVQVETDHRKEEAREDNQVSD